MVCAVCRKSHTHVMHPQANPLLSLSSSLYIRWRHTVLWLMCAVTVWKAQEGKAVLPLMPLLLWTRRDKSTHKHGCTHTTTDKQITTQIHIACTNTPFLSTSPADQLTRGLAFINSTSISHILVCSQLNNLQSPVQLKVFELAVQDKHWRLLVKNRQIITAHRNTELLWLVIQSNHSGCSATRSVLYPFIGLWLCVCMD